MTKTRRISLLILSVLLSAVTVVSGFTVYRELSLQQKEKEDFAALAKLVQITSPKAQPCAAFCAEQRLHRLAEHSRYAAKLPCDVHAGKPAEIPTPEF